MASLLGINLSLMEKKMALVLCFFIKENIIKANGLMILNVVMGYSYFKMAPIILAHGKMI
jgi:hypothetical protein